MKKTWFRYFRPRKFWKNSKNHFQVDCEHVNEASKKKSPCPKTFITEDGFVMVSKFLSEHTGTILNCENNGNKVETTLLVVTPPTGESGIE